MKANTELFYNSYKLRRLKEPKVTEAVVPRKGLDSYLAFSAGPKGSLFWAHGRCRPWRAKDSS